MRIALRNEKTVARQVPASHEELREFAEWMVDAGFIDPSNKDWAVDEEFIYKGKPLPEFGWNQAQRTTYVYLENGAELADAAYGGDWVVIGQGGAAMHCTDRTFRALFTGGARGAQDRKTYTLKLPKGTMGEGYVVRESTERGGWEWVWGGDGEPDEHSREVFATPEAALRDVARDAEESVGVEDHGRKLAATARGMATKLENRAEQPSSASTGEGK